MPDTTVGTASDRDAVKFLDSLTEESNVRRDESGISDADINIRFLRGQQWPEVGINLSGRRAETNQFRFVMNLVSTMMARKSAIITDSRPQINVVSRSSKHWDKASDAMKESCAYVWDDQALDQNLAREIVRAGTLGCTVAMPVWEPKADYGRGKISLLFYDPRQFAFDPSITRSTDMPKAEYQQVWDIVPLNWVREAYPSRGDEVKPSLEWSSYEQPKARRSGYSGILTAVGQPWRRNREETASSATPRTRLRHSWFRDWQRDDDGKPIWSRPRLLRHMVDASGIILVDEPMPYWHRALPGHLFDWNIELEHAWGVSEVGGLRRIQYTLNRIVGQIVDNILMNNRIRVKSDVDAVDNKTWDLITQNPNGVYIRKRTGRQFDYENPGNIIPTFVLDVVRLLIESVDLVTGLSDTSQGRTPAKALSGVALEGLQQAAQSIVRLEARALEDWLERIFQQVISLVWQFWGTDKLLAILGPDQKFHQYEFIRRTLISDDENNMLREDAWQDFVFKVIPGTSLSSSRMQRGIMAMNLQRAGLIPAVDVLRAADWPDPEGSVKAAAEERLAQQQQGIQVEAERKHRATQGPTPLPGAGRRLAMPV